MQQELKELQERTTRSEGDWAAKEAQQMSQQQLLEERVGDLTKQNTVLHEEAEKVSRCCGRGGEDGRPHQTKHSAA